MKLVKPGFIKRHQSKGWREALAPLFRFLFVLCLETNNVLVVKLQQNIAKGFFHVKNAEKVLTRSVDSLVDETFNFCSQSRFNIFMY